MTTLASATLKEDGFQLLRAQFTPERMRAFAQQLTEYLSDDADATLRSRGAVYGSRNLISDCPPVVDLALSRQLHPLLMETLGEQVGLVRALFFDKPPGRSWSLPWHRDRTIAVQRNDFQLGGFGKPTCKAGVPHMEAPAELLARMLTLRIHLDPVNSENGPLFVIPRSHLTDQDTIGPAVEIHAGAGDVLAMRPLISHASKASSEGSLLHRRIVHLEYAPEPRLSHGYEWQQFLPIRRAES